MTSREIARLLIVHALGIASRGWGVRPRLIGAERILVIRPDHLGDVVLATAVLRALRRSHPGADIAALVGPWSATVLQTNTDVDRVLTFPFPWFDRRPVPSPVERYLIAIRLASRLRAFSFDRAIILRPDHWWGGLVIRMAGIPHRTGYAGTLLSPLLTHPIPRQTSEHAVISGLRLIDPSRGPGPAFQPSLPLTRLQPNSADLITADSLLASVFERWPNRLAIIHPGASVAPKRWPAERWAIIADRLSQSGWSVAVAAGPGEGAIADEIANRTMKPIANLREILSVGVMAALFSRADIALGMDSAPMHFATAVGTPTIRLFGPGDECLFGPWGDPRTHRVVRAPATTPDDAWFGQGGAIHPTIDAIDAERVWRTFNDILPHLDVGRASRAAP